MANSFSGVVGPGKQPGSTSSFAQADRAMTREEWLSGRTAEEADRLYQQYRQSNDQDLLVSVGEDGKASITTQDGRFKIEVAEDKQSVKITDTKTGEVTEIWGDPHVDLHHQNNDGKTVDWDFKKDMTFLIPASVTGSSDLKISVRTTFDPSNPDKPTYCDGLTVNYGDDAVKLDGIYSPDKTLTVFAVRANSA